MKKVDFIEPIKGSDGTAKNSDPLFLFVADAFESYSQINVGDRAAVWDMVGEIRRNGEVEFSEQDIELFLKYWEQMDVRLDIFMQVKNILKEAPEIEGEEDGMD